MSGRDGRSIGELVLDADHTARDLLIDAPDLDAAVVLRTWGEVVETAAEVWAALPTPPVPPMPGEATAPAGTRPDVMSQLSVMTHTLTRGVRRGPWPGPGDTDPRLQRIADTFARAAHLLRAHAGPAVSDPAVRADVDAARTRIILTLYIAAHGVRVAVAAHSRKQEDALRARHQTRAARSLVVTRPALHRLDAFELVAAAYVTAHFPAALAGEHREDVRASRIGEALAAWDVHAHRALAAQPTAGHLRMVAMTQELVLRHGAQILMAAATTGAIDPQQYTARLQAPLEASRTAWSSSAAGWSELAGHTPRPDAPALTTAAAEVRASLRAVTVDGPAPATALVLAQRTDLPQAARHVATALSASSDLAHLVSDVTNDPRLTFPARAVNAVIVAAATTPNGGAVPGSPIGSAVAIRDLTANRPVPLPHILRGSFVQDADILIGATGTAAAAGVWLHDTRTTHGPDPEPRPTSAPAHHPRRLDAPRPISAGTPRGR